MLNFTKFERINPEKRDVLQRLKDYNEVYQVFGKQRAREQSDRCMQCGDPYCHTGCPLHNFIPAWLKQTAEKNLDLAFALSNETSPFPEILGRICPQDVLCEGACSLNTGHGAVSIGAVETHLNERAFENGMKPRFAAIKGDKKVAIIGSGPSGISAATFLLRRGIAVEMFERDDRAGGLLMYGIPGFKLDKTTVDRRINWLIEAGMKLHLNCEIGKDKSILDLEKEFDAIFIGIGAKQGRFAGIEGEDSSNTYLAMDFLTGIQKRNLGKEVDFIEVKDKKVVVIGGGDTAMDCVRSSVREGAKSVKCLYRRDESNMPGSKKEVVNSKEEGVEFVFNVSPKKIITLNNEAQGIELLKTGLSEPDESGRRRVSIIDGSEHTEDADIIIFALGFSPEVPKFLSDANIKTNSWGGIEINELCQTSNSKFYAGGDCQRGAHLAVTAAADGREAAKEITKLFS
ncbi:MAG: glutamate synthase subunit beta [Arcobacter sp.]|nr:glutamate synthase subunit beta [Arcobacter sp.]